jgi:hypothetical protein
VSTLAVPIVDLPADVRLLMCFMRSSAHVLYTKVMGNECTFSLSTTRLHSSCLKEISGVSENTLQKNMRIGSLRMGGALRASCDYYSRVNNAYKCSLCYTNIFLCVLLEYTNRKYCPVRGKQILSCGKLNC